MPRKTRSSPSNSAPRRQTHTAAAPVPAPAAAPAPIIVQQPSMGGGGMLQNIASVAVGSAIVSSYLNYRDIL